MQQQEVKAAPEIGDESAGNVPESELRQILKAQTMDFVGSAHRNNMAELQLVCQHAPERLRDPEKVLLHTYIFQSL